MTLHGGDHLELKKPQGGFSGTRLGICPGIIPEKISFLQFYSRFLCFFTKATFKIFQYIKVHILFLSTLFWLILVMKASPYQGTVSSAGGGGGRRLSSIPCHPDIYKYLFLACIKFSESSEEYPVHGGHL